MKLRLLLLCVLLALLFVSCEMKKKDKDNKHGHGHGHSHSHGHGHGHSHHHHHHPPPGKHGRGRFEEITTDVFFQVATDDDDDDDEHSSDWLYELQEPEGPCNPNPCHNNGVCEEEKKGKKFKCDCPKPFKGKKCERGPRHCKKGRCGRGECVVTSSPPFFECKCKEPFKPPNCVKYSVCDPNPCKNGGKCVRDGNDFDCACAEGFSGRYCQVGPNDCYTGDGESYRGNVSETDDGHECLYWNSHFLLDSGTNPFGSSENEDGLGLHNFCRNPDGSQMPWCFFRKGRKLWWDYCDVRRCDEPTGEPATVEPTDQPDPTQPAPPSPGPTEPVPPPPGPTQPVPPAPTTHVYDTTAPPGPSSAPESTAAVPGPTNATNTTDTAQFKTCGHPEPKKPITRIYAGLKVPPGALPWQVSLQVRPQNSNLPFRHLCGGILIESCWVLTAGHCIHQNRDMQVVLGSNDLSSEEPNQQTLTVEEAIRHENYNEKPYAVYNDIGLLRLQGQNGVCAKESQFVKTACLPEAPLPDGTECTISGWGATENATGSQHLLEAKVLLINQEKCSQPEVYGAVLDNGMMCAGHLRGGVDSCQGDSGGPLTCEDHNSFVVYGVVSWGDQCGKKNKPGVYTRVTQYLDWIKSKISAPPK